jgi:hypothetical protein
MRPRKTAQSLCRVSAPLSPDPTHSVRTRTVFISTRVSPPFQFRYDPTRLIQIGNRIEIVSASAMSRWISPYKSEPIPSELVDKIAPIAASLPHEPPPMPSCFELCCLVEKRRWTSPVLARRSPWTEDHQRVCSPTHSIISSFWCHR